MRRVALLLVLVVTASICLAGSSGSGTLNKPIGQIVASGVRMDGVTVPSGTTLFSRSLLTTGDNPATIRLTTGDLLQLGGNSKAYFDSAANGEVNVAVNAGTLAYNHLPGKTIMAASPASVSFPQRRTGATITAAAPPQTSVIALLTQAANRGDTRLLVNDTSRFNPEARTMIKTRDGQINEVHYVKSIGKNIIVLRLPLQFSFSAEDMVIQGCECDTEVGAPADGIVAYLISTVQKNATEVKVRTVGMVDPEARTLLKRKDGSIQEVHRIQSFAGDTVFFEEGVMVRFEPGDMLMQGCNVPSFFVPGSWTWKHPFLLGLGGGATTVATPMALVDHEPSREECSKCQELHPDMYVR